MAKAFASQGDLAEKTVIIGKIGEGLHAFTAEGDTNSKDDAIDEHCLPFDVSRADDEARGIETPRIWTAERRRPMRDALQA